MALIAGLLVYYDYDEAAGKLLDKHGANDGTLTGCTQNQPGKINTCYTMNGVGDHIDLDALVAVTDTDYTFAYWAKYAADGKSIAGLVGDGNCYVTWFSGGNLFHKTNGSGANYANVASGIGDISAWHYYMVRRNGDGNDLDFWVDGVKKPAAYNGTLPNNPCTIDVLGMQHGGGNFAGSLDEFPIWDRALTDGECGQMWNGGAGLPYPLVPSVGAPLAAMNFKRRRA